RRIGMAALGVALAVPLLPIPAIQGGLLGETGAGIGAGSGGGGTISAVNPLVSLRDSLNIDQDRTVLTVRTNSSNLSDMYLRIVSLDDFDGTTWRPSRKRIQEVPKDFPTPVGLRSSVKRTEVSTQITAAGWYAQDWLPMPYPPSGVQIKGNWRFEPEGMTLVGDHGQNTRGLTYQVNSLEVRPTAEQLAAAPPARASILNDYTEVPPSLPQVVWREAREITRGAGTDYAKAVALQDYFAVTGGFQYDTQVEVGSGPDAIARFLRDKQGFCVHYSFAMAAMARTLGIPARVAVGFAPGTPQGNGTVQVSLKDAHAWPELYFEGIGWTRFEPTPTRGSTPEYTLPDTGDTATPVIPENPATASAAPSSAPSASASCSSAQRKENGCASTAPVDRSADGGGGTPWYRVAWWSLLAVLVIAVPLLPMLWRLRRRSIRLASARHTGAGDGPPGDRPG
ncbi:transglutaminase family protein, partial [Streptomyces sp. S6]